MTMMNICDNDQVHISDGDRKHASLSVSKYGDLLARWHFCDERCAAAFFAVCAITPNRAETERR